MIRRFPLAALVATLAVVSCSKEVETPTAGPRPVYTIVVAKAEPNVSRAFSGVLSPAEGASISFEVGGRVTQVLAKTGRRYKKGDVLAKLDPRDFQIDLDAAAAKKTEAAQVEARNRLLWESKNLSDADYQASVAALRAAEASYNGAKKKVDDCTLRMPYDGTLATKSLDAQSVVSAGSAVMTLEGDSGMEFLIGIPANDIALIKREMSAQLTLGSLPGKTFSASVLSVGTQPSTNSTYPVNLSVDLKEDPAVRAGMDGEAVLALPKINGANISVPVECVVGSPPDEQFVWLIDPGESAVHTISRHLVTAGELTSGGHIEILNESLKEGQRVVSRGVHRLSEGESVTLVESK